MVKHTLVAAVVALNVVSSAAGLQQSSPPLPVRSMYNDALAKEAAVRKALDDPQATEAVLSLLTSGGWLSPAEG